MKKLLENRKIRIAALAVLLAALLVASFFAGAGFDRLGVSGVNNSPMGGWDKIEDGGGDYVNNTNGMTGGAGSTADEGRKIIKTVTIYAQTDNYDGFISSLKSKVFEAGGRIDREYSSGEDFYAKETLRHSSLTIRIPAQELDGFTAGVESLCVVTSYRENLNDVTEAYIDTETRISVLAAKEKALLEMLSKAENVTDLLAIDERLTSLQAELESLKAQKDSYDDRVAYSTINLTVNEVKHAEIKNPTFGEAVKSEFEKSLENISEGVERLGVIIFGNIIYIIIALAVIAALIPIVCKLIKKQITNKNNQHFHPTSASQKSETAVEKATNDTPK